MALRYRNAIVCAALASVSSSGAAEEQGSKALQSRFANEQQYRAILDENARIGGEIDRLKGFQASVNQAKQCVGDLRLNEQSVSETVNALRSGYEQLRKMPPAADVTGRIGVGQDMNRAIGNLYQAAVGSLFECMRTLRPEFRPPGQAGDPLLDSIRAVIEPGRAAADTDPIGDLMPKTLVLVRSFPYDGALKRSALAGDQLAGIQAELQGLTVQAFLAPFQAQKTAILNRLDTALAQANAEINARAEKLKQNEARLQNLDNSLVEKQAAQTALDRGLVWAIYGMMVVLAVLFLSLRIFPSDLARQVLQDRSMVELVSMAFILLTIIILGTGNKIGNETIGTLLGTIAGYVFGRKLAEEARPRAQQPPAAAVPKPTPP